MTPDLPAIAEAIAAAGGPRLDPARSVRVGGGSISAAWAMHGDGESCFVKTNGASFAANFAAEADGLAALGRAAVPRSLTFTARGVVGATAFLALEHLDLRPLDAASGHLLGGQLAQLHRHAGEAFGWPSDNFIGASPQRNTSHPSWPHFFAEQRLRPQLELAARNGMDGTLRKTAESVAANIGGLFVDYQPRPSLLHGDLWSGNAAALPDGTPVIFDPACYHGDREADIAMAELFGGFPGSFYAAYRAAWPLDDGYETRKTLYNLYHVLNHFNLFGAGYLGQARRMIEQLNRELRRLP